MQTASGSQSLQAANASAAVLSQSMVSKKPTVFNLLKERYQGDKNRNRILDVIQLFLHQNGKTMAVNETPLINGKVIDLSTLFLYVAGQGGFATIDPSKGWTTLAVKMGYSSTSLAETAGATLKEVYSKIFLDFEMHLANKKAQQQKQQNQHGVVEQPSKPKIPVVTPQSATIATAAPAAALKEEFKVSKKRDRQQFQEDSATGETSSAPVAATSNNNEAPNFSFSRNPSDSALMADCVVDLCSRKMSDVVRGLNTLTLRSAEYEARALNLESHPYVVMALGELLDMANPAVVPFFEELLVSEGFNAIQYERSGINWNSDPSIRNVEVGTYLCIYILMITLRFYGHLLVELTYCSVVP